MGFIRKLIFVFNFPKENKREDRLTSNSVEMNFLQLTPSLSPGRVLPGFPSAVQFGFSAAKVEMSCVGFQNTSCNPSRGEARRGSRSWLPRPVRDPCCFFASLHKPVEEGTLHLSQGTVDTTDNGHCLFSMRLYIVQ